MSAKNFMRGSHTSRIIWHRVQGIGGQADRSIEVAAFVGQVTYADGERGTYVGVEAVGAVDDPDAFRGSAIIVLDDGSVSNQTFEGKTESKDGPDRFAGTGTWRMVSGTGRFAGLQGSGPFKWSLIGDQYEDEFGV